MQPIESGAYSRLGPPSGIARLLLKREDWLKRLMCLGFVIFLVAAYLLPLVSLLSKSTEGTDGQFVGVANFATYLDTPEFASSVIHSVLVASSVAAISVFLAFVFAYALTRSCMPWKAALKAIALFPIFGPPMMAAIAIQYLFGNQGPMKAVLAGHSIYGPIGIIIAHVILVFPLALLILTTALELADARLYEAASTMGTRALRAFLTITFPTVRYGIINALAVGNYPLDAGYTLKVT